MAERPVSARDYDPADWRLAPKLQKDVQGIVVSGFSKQTASCALFLFIPWEKAPTKGGWLKALREVAPVTDSDGADEKSVALAFTFDGLSKVGLDDNVLEGFDRPFK